MIKINIDIVFSQKSSEAVSICEPRKMAMPLRGRTVKIPFSDKEL